MAGSSERRKTRRILVIDDMPDEREALAAVLSAHGYAVTAVASLQEARKGLEKPPFAVVLDVVLSEGNSVAFAAELVARHPAVLVVVVSGRADRELMFEVGRVPVHAFLSKPVSVAALLEALSKRRVADRWLAQAARRSVGKVSLRSARDVVRTQMVDRAVELAGGNKSEAASLLGTTRQAVQKAVAGKPRARRQ